MDRVRLSGLGAREGVFRAALAEELKISVGPLADAEDVRALPSNAKDLLNQDLDALVGWMMNSGS